jgi:hypothetical protein
VGAIEGTNWWNHPRGIQVLPKRQGIVLATNWDLPTCDATSSDVAFQTQQSVNPFHIYIWIWFGNWVRFIEEWGT